MDGFMFFLRPKNMGMSNIVCIFGEDQKNVYIYIYNGNVYIFWGPRIWNFHGHLKTLKSGVRHHPGPRMCRYAAAKQRQRQVSADFVQPADFMVVEWLMDD